MFYQLTEEITQIPEAEMPSCEDPLVAIFTVSEWERFMTQNGLNPTPTTAYENSVVCKMESYQDGLFGTFSIPLKRDFQAHDHFACYITKSALYFIDDDVTVCDTIAKIRITTDTRITIGRFFVHFVEQLIAYDMRYLEELESRIAELEEDILDGQMQGFNQKMIAIRKELADYHRYYAQMTDVGQALQTDGDDLFSARSIGLFKRFTERLIRLQGEVTLLREYSLQVREVYQSLVDIRQNEIMRVLTVVTAIFLPLTLIVGWYGMNFTFMPELKWRFGYPLVILLSVAVALFCVRIFKKKKYW